MGAPSPMNRHNIGGARAWRECGRPIAFEELTLPQGQVIMRWMEHTGEKLLTKKVLAFLLVLALFLCHGLSETVHRYAADGASPMGSYPSSVQMPVDMPTDNGGYPDVGTGTLNHTATLLLSLTAVVWLWRAPLRGRGTALPPLSPCNALESILHRPSGEPIRALLVVFRL